MNRVPLSSPCLFSTLIQPMMKDVWLESERESSSQLPTPSPAPARGCGWGRTTRRPTAVRSLHTDRRCRASPMLSRRQFQPGPSSSPGRVRRRYRAEATQPYIDGGCRFPAAKALTGASMSDSIWARCQSTRWRSQDLREERLIAGSRSKKKKY